MACCEAPTRGVTSQAKTVPRLGAPQKGPTGSHKRRLPRTAMCLVSLWWRCPRPRQGRLGRPHNEAHAGCSVDVGNMGVEQHLPEVGRQLARGERNPRPCQEGRGGQELLEGSEPSRHGAVRDPGMAGMRRATAWVWVFIVLEETMVTHRPPGAGMTSCHRMVCGPPQPPTTGERRLDCLIKASCHCDCRPSSRSAGG